MPWNVKTTCDDIKYINLRYNDDILRLNYVYY